MEKIESSLKRLCFSGNQEDYYIWSTRFLAFADNGATVDVAREKNNPMRPPVLPNESTDAQQNIFNAQIEARRAAEVQPTKKKHHLLLVGNGA